MGCSHDYEKASQIPWFPLSPIFLFTIINSAPIIFMATKASGQFQNVVLKKDVEY
jgi:hypothetical protein